MKLEWVLTKVNNGFDRLGNLQYYTHHELFADGEAVVSEEGPVKIKRTVSVVDGRNLSDKLERG